MPLKLNVGASKKVGEAGYGSRGASVNLELELESALVAEPAKLQEKIRQLFGLVRTALAEELNGNGKPAPPSSPNHAAPPAQSPAATNGSSQPREAFRASTPAQCKAIYAMARRQGLALDDWLRQRCDVPRPEDLTVRQASTCIDALKSSGDSPRH